MPLIKRKGKDLIVEGFDLTYSNQIDLELNGQLPVDIDVQDKRHMSNQQRKFIFALCNIFEYESGQDKEMFRAIVMQSAKDNLNIKKDSLTEYTMTDANRLIELIIATLIQHDIPISNELIEENNYKWTEKHSYLMCLKRICVVCGRRADIHHVDAIGMRSRAKISHTGLRALPLCRTHHTQCHSVGNKAFIERHYLTPCVIDEKLEHFIKKGNLKVYETKESD